MRNLIRLRVSLIRKTISEVYSRIQSNISNVFVELESIPRLFTHNSFFMIETISLHFPNDHFCFNSFFIFHLPSSIFLFRLFSTIPLPNIQLITSSTTTSSVNHNMAPNSALSARDVEVLAAAFQSLKTPPEVRYSTFFPDSTLVALLLDHLNAPHDQHSSIAQPTLLHTCSPTLFRSRHLIISTLKKTD